MISNDAITYFGLNLFLSLTYTKFDSTDETFLKTFLIKSIVKNSSPISSHIVRFAPDFMKVF